jgi:aspartate aminotransferase
LKATSSLVRSLDPSPTVASLDKVRALKSQGLDILSFSAGEPDFATPPHIVEAASRSMQSGFTHYVSSRGIPELLESIASDLHARIGVELDPQKEIIVTTGSKMAIYITLVGLLNPGDEVLILDPSWISYDPMTRLASGKPVHVPLDWRKGFSVTGDLDQHVTSRTKAIILNSPNNPTGHVMSRAELEIIADLADRHDLFVISDEIYDRITYGDSSTSPASLPGLRARTLITNGFSKAYAMTGWRLGYVAGNKDLIAQILLVQQHVVTCGASFAEVAAAAALRGPQDCVQDMVEEYRRRRELMVRGLNELPGVTCAMPEGAFYAFPRFEGLAFSSQQVADRLLDECLISTTPGIAFGSVGEGHLRFSFACSLQSIDTGLARLRKCSLFR